MTDGQNGFGANMPWNRYGCSGWGLSMMEVALQASSAGWGSAEYGVQTREPPSRAVMNYYWNLIPLWPACCLPRFSTYELRWMRAVLREYTRTRLSSDYDNSFVQSSLRDSRFHTPLVHFLLTLLKIDHQMSKEFWRSRDWLRTVHSQHFQYLACRSPLQKSVQVL